VNNESKFYVDYLGTTTMSSRHQLSLSSDDFKKLTARQVNIIRSPKKNGTAQDDSKPYLEELGVEIIENKQSIQFTKNSNELVHRWSPYVQGFSAQFVQKTLDRYKSEYSAPIIFDPFAGSGTVLVQAKLNNDDTYGVELNPLLHFVAKTKINTWKINPEKLLKISGNLLKTGNFKAPEFLKSENHFTKGVLRNLELIKSSINNFNPASNEDKKIKNLLLVAFSAILIDCSNLKRSPCLGYSRKKIVTDETPFLLLNKKIKEIISDLRIIKTEFKEINSNSEIYLANSNEFDHPTNYDLVITSPPYMNGMDYVMNYKIEMGWLDFADDHKQLKHVKDDMVVCDNVSKGLIKNFSNNGERYSNNWIENIKDNIKKNIERRGSYRRPDMPEIVHKYFDDMYAIMKNVISAIKKNSRFILVVGDSLIADVYVPTDLLIAKIGNDLGLSIEKIEKARDRRSGQIRSYKLRETIVTLKKD
jgi:DNA modification methylase